MPVASTGEGIEATDSKELVGERKDEGFELFDEGGGRTTEGAETVDGELREVGGEEAFDFQAVVRSVGGRGGREVIEVVEGDIAEEAAEDFGTGIKVLVDPTGPVLRA